MTKTKIDLNSTIHKEVLDQFKDQLLIVLIKRLGGTISIPVTEVDDTGRDVLSFSITTTSVTQSFNFTVGKKQ